VPEMMMMMIIIIIIIIIKQSHYRPGQAHKVEEG
jgi:hypothetical protein